MGETALEEMFAEFEADALTTFRPPGVPDAQRRTRDRRRRRRGLLAGVAALLLAGPAGAFAMAGRGGDPSPVPSPTMTASPPKPIERKVALPDVEGDLRELRFVEAGYGWALFDTCNSNDPQVTGCRRTVARTTDGGATWRKAALPAATKGSAHLLPVNDRTLTVAVGDRYLVTTDGGASFTSHPFGSPPLATRMAAATPTGFLIRCPGGNGLEDGARGRECDREELARADSGPVKPQPPVALRMDVENQLAEGGDGRLWLAVPDGDRMTVLVSTDRAATWRKLPAVGGVERLLVSPDGRDVWLTSMEGAKPVWELVEERWQQRPGLPDDTAAVAATGGGMLAVTGAYGSAGFWVDGRYVDRPEVRDALRGDSNAQPGVEVLPDGSVLLTYGLTQIIGTGSSIDRTWIRIS